MAQNFETFKKTSHSGKIELPSSVRSTTTVQSVDRYPHRGNKVFLNAQIWPYLVYTSLPRWAGKPEAEKQNETLAPPFATGSTENESNARKSAKEACRPVKHEELALKKSDEDTRQARNDDQE